MKIEVDITKTAMENAARYFEEAKKMKRKAEAAKQEIEKTEAGMQAAAGAKKQVQKPKVKRKKEWYEKFRWFFTSDGFLAIAGRDAKQNEQVVARHLEEGDLFLHADIYGAPATILKNGKTAPERSLEEAAVFAASYSNAWRSGLGSVDVYAVGREQVSKYSSGEYVPKGGFAIKGKRKWFRNTQLGICIGIAEIPCAIPENSSKDRFSAFACVTPGKMKKSECAAKIKHILWKAGSEIALDEIIPLLPPGESEIARKS